MTKYTFTTKNNNYKSANYSKMLDDIIAADIANKNSFLFDTNKNKFFDNLFKTKKKTITKNDYYDAIKYLCDYNKKNKFIIGHTYTLNDGTPIIFYDDEIQIGFDIYKYSDFLFDTIDIIDEPKKNIIIDIYSDSINISIK